jgi:hypothetical protein
MVFVDSPEHFLDAIDRGEGKLEMYFVLSFARFTASYPTICMA